MACLISMFFCGAMQAQNSNTSPFPDFENSIEESSNWYSRTQGFLATVCEGNTSLRCKTYIPISTPTTGVLTLTSPSGIVSTYSLNYPAFNSGSVFSNTVFHNFNEVGDWIFEGSRNLEGAICTVKVLPQPAATFTVTPNPGCLNDVFLFDGSASYPPVTSINIGGVPTNVVSWTFGDPLWSTVGGTFNPNFTYINAGTFNATLKIHYEDSWTYNNVTYYTTICQDQSSVPITVNAPKAYFNLHQSYCAGAPVSFTDLSSCSFGIQNWYWDFGDGSPLSNSQNPTHTYSSPGVYTVSLQIQDMNGNFSVYSMPITITTGPVLNSISSSSGGLYGCNPPSPLPLTVYSVDPNNSNYSYNWTVSGGWAQNPNDPSTPIQWGVTGTPSVTVEVTDPTTGCTSSITQELEACCNFGGSALVLYDGFTDTEVINKMAVAMC